MFAFIVGVVIGAIIAVIALYALCAWFFNSITGWGWW